MNRKSLWAMTVAAFAGTLLLAGCRTQQNAQTSVQTPPEPAPPPPAAPERVRPSPVKFELASSGLPIEGNWKCVPRLADVDADGNVDIVISEREGQGARVFRNDGRCRWTDSSDGLKMAEPSCGGGVAVADLNSDGKLDLAVGDHCHGIYIFHGDGQNHWRELVAEQRTPKVDGVTPFPGCEDIAVGDVNGDGFDDLVVGAFDSGGVQVFTGDATGAAYTFAASTLPTDGWANRVKLVDVNGDGKLDVVAARMIGAEVWLGNGRNNWTESSDGLGRPPIQGLYWGLDVADLNEDGRVDLILGNWINGVEVYLQEADGSWKLTADVFPDLRGGAHGVATGDLNGDGHTDIVACGRMTKDTGFVYGVFALLGDGKGNFTPLKDAGLPETGLAFSWGVAVGDLNHDGAPDVVVGSGGIVPSQGARTTPIVPERVLVWTTKRVAK